MALDLTLKDRMFLYNQLEILRRLAEDAGDQDSASRYKLQQEIVEMGYSHDYDELFRMVNDNQMTKEEMEFVWNVLNMYQAIYDAFEGNPDIQAKHEREEIKFRGFDGNYEGKHRLYCLFILESLWLDTEINKNRQNDLNSHQPMIESYRKMLSKWDSMGKLTQLNETQFDELINS